MKSLQVHKLHGFDLNSLHFIMAYQVPQTFNSVPIMILINAQLLLLVAHTNRLELVCCI